MATTVEQLYTQILGRQPDAEGLSFWKSAFGNSVDPAEQASFMQSVQSVLAATPIAQQEALAPKLVYESVVTGLPIAKVIESLPAPQESAPQPTISLKDQLLAQWSKLGVTELPGGISLEERASALADTMKQNGITNLADLKLGSKTIQTGEDGGTTNASFLSNKGQQLGFLGNVNENLKNKADYLQPDNLLSWSSEGKGNVGYKAVETADGGVAIVPQWNSSSDLKTIRNIAKLAAAVYFGGMGLESLES